MSSDALPTDEPELAQDWAEFRVLLEQYLPSTIELSLDLTLDAVTQGDRLAKAQLHGGMRELLNQPPDDLLASIHTIRDALHWWIVRGRGRGEGEASSWLTRSGDSEVVSFRAQAPRCALRPLQPEDLKLLYEAMAHPDIGFRWRLRGVTATPEQILESLNDSCFVNYMVERRPQKTVMGLVSAYNPSFTDGIVHFGLIRCGSNSGVPIGEMFEGLYLFLDYLFFNWDFRKAYAEIPGFNWDLFKSGEGELFEVEGVLSEHDYLAGRYWDQRIITVTRARWSRIRETWGRVIHPYTTREEAQ